LTRQQHSYFLKAKSHQQKKQKQTKI